MKRLLFTRVDVEIFEDIDFPEDPAPYVRIHSREPDFTLELEEARDLGRALTQWVLETEERERRRERDRRRQLEQLDDVAREILADAAAVARAQPPAVMTLLELIIANRRPPIPDDDDRPREPRIVKRRRRKGAA
jgi:hypothetical protein